MNRFNRDTIVLVRDDVDVLHQRWMKMTKWWTGPKHGWAQGPKKYFIARLHHEKVIWRVGVGHWPFNKARQETFDRVRVWFRRPKRKVVSIYLGDLNTHAAELAVYSNQFRAKQVGIGVDRAIYKNCQATARDLGKHGSDHRAILFTFVTPAPKK